MTPSEFDTASSEEGLSSGRTTPNQRSSRHGGGRSRDKHAEKRKKKKGKSQDKVILTSISNKPSISSSSALNTATTTTLTTNSSVSSSQSVVEAQVHREPFSRQDSTRRSIRGGKSRSGSATRGRSLPKQQSIPLDNDQIFQAVSAVMGGLSAAGGGDANNPIVLNAAALAAHSPLPPHHYNVPGIGKDDNNQLTDVVAAAAAVVDDNDDDDGDSSVFLSSSCRTLAAQSDAGFQVNLALDAMIPVAEKPQPSKVSSPVGKIIMWPDLTKPQMANLKPGKVIVSNGRPISFEILKRKSLFQAGQKPVPSPVSPHRTGGKNKHKVLKVDVAIQTENDIITDEKPDYKVHILYTYLQAIAVEMHVCHIFG